MIDFLFPRICVLCHHASHSKRDLCDTCHSHFPIIPHACVRCATPLSTEQTSLTCGLCLTTSRSFDIIHTLYHYEQPITRLILDLKFNHTLLYAALLGRLLLEHVQSSWYRSKPLPDILMPMPLHATRLQARGFNQALEIARPLAKTLKIPLETEMSQRIKSTLPQATLSATARSQNVKGAFSVTKDVTNKHIAIIDDVVTTGNTVSALSATLKSRGARQIDVWCAARS